MSGVASGSGSLQAVSGGPTCTVYPDLGHTNLAESCWLWRKPLDDDSYRSIDVRLLHPDGSNDPWAYLVFDVSPAAVGRDSSLERYFNFDPESEKSATHLQVQQDLCKWQTQAQLVFANSTFNTLAEQIQSVSVFVMSSGREACKENVAFILGKPTLSVEIAPFTLTTVSKTSLSLYKGWVNQAVDSCLAAAAHPTGSTSTVDPKRQKVSKLTGSKKSPQSPPNDQLWRSYVLQYIQDCQATSPRMTQAKQELRGQLNAFCCPSASPDPHKRATGKDWVPALIGLFGSTPTGRLALDEEFSRLSSLPPEILMEGSPETTLRVPFTKMTYDHERKRVRDIRDRSFQQTASPQWNRNPGSSGGSASQGGPTGHDSSLVITAEDMKA